MKRWIVPLCIAVAALPAYAQQQAPVTNDTVTAGALYKGCLAASAIGADDKLCNPYFRGLTDGLYIMQQMAESHRRTCMPDETAVSVDDARRIFNGYIVTHPDMGPHSAGLIAAIAIFAAYPCPK